MIFRKVGGARDRQMEMIEHTEEKKLSKKKNRDENRDENKKREGEIYAKKSIQKSETQLQFGTLVSSKQCKRIVVKVIHSTLFLSSFSPLLPCIPVCLVFPSLPSLLSYHH